MSVLSKLSAGAVLVLGLGGCANLPGDSGSQGAVIGGVSGAAVGAAVGGKEHRVLGAILGGAIGTAGGYVIGANKDKIIGRDSEGAESAAQTATTNPATPQDALQAATADLNGDGFVTLDEVVAMKKAGLADDVVLERMRATDQVFELTADQQEYLVNNGISRATVTAMEQINQGIKQEVISNRGDVISR